MRKKDLIFYINRIKQVCFFKSDYCFFSEDEIRTLFFKYLDDIEKNIKEIEKEVLKWD